jgi:peptide deformylase
MVVRKILVWPDEKLRIISDEIKLIDKNIKYLIRDLIDTMKVEPNCAGIAAPQIGVNKRIFIVNILSDINFGDKVNDPKYFINPKIVKKRGLFKWKEGCLSIPGETGMVERYEYITLRFIDLNGKTKYLSAYSFLSGCIQHEFDHLNGKLWIDYQSKLKQMFVKNKMLKRKKYKNII